MSSVRRPSKTDVVSDFRRAQLLDAARQVFASQGITRTTIEAIARKAKLAKGTVYLYYRSKDELLLKILEQDLAQLRDETVPFVCGEAALEEKLVRFFVAALTVSDRKRAYFEHADVEMSADVRRKALQKVEVVFREQIDAWQRALAKAARAGVIQKGDFSATAHAIVALANGMARQRLRGWRTASVEAVASEAAAILWKGLAAS